MTVIKREPCPDCVANGGDSKGDNLVTHADGGLYCYKCNESKKGGESEKVEKKEPIQKDMERGEYKALVKRNISLETCRKYGYQVGKGCQIANFYDDAGNVVMQKIRFVTREGRKGFRITGNTNNTNILYGSWLFTPNDKLFITITEGEIDALSVADTLKKKYGDGYRYYPVVSLTNGAQSAEKIITKNLKYLQGFSHVVLAFDNDEPGRKAVEACLPLFEPGKVRIAKWTEKDASDLLQASKRREIQSTVYDAVEYMPEPIKTGADLLKTLDNYKTKTKAWPWSTANNNISPIHIPAVYTIAAKPAVGKTLFCAELMRATIADGGKVGIIALEETIQKVLIKMTATLYNLDLNDMLNRELNEHEKEKCALVANSLVVYDHITFGSDISNICDNIPFMVRGCGCDLIIFDNLSYSATGLAGNERVGIDKAMVQLKDSTVKYEYTLLNVTHLKRDDMDGFSSPSAEMIRGSQGVEMYSDYIIGLDRDKSSEDLTERNTLSIHILKDRMTGSDTGKMFSLYYNKDTGRLEDMGGPLV